MHRAVKATRSSLPLFPPSLLSFCSRARQTTAQAMTGAKKLGTHSGTFHCDEALGCAMLLKTTAFAKGLPGRLYASGLAGAYCQVAAVLVVFQQLPTSVSRFAAAESLDRDPAVWKEMDIVIDVGGEYNHDTCRYDHHQRGFEEVFGHGFVTKLSSAGLVYKHYGLDIIAGFMSKPAEDPDVHTVWVHVYKNFIEAVDAVDNGVNQYEDVSDPRYVDNTTLSKRVGALNPGWNEPSGNDAMDARFADAVKLTGKEFDFAVQHTVSSWLPARSIVAKALQGATSVHSSGAIMVAKPYCPWKSHIFDLEKEQGCEGRTLYVVYEDDRDGSWRLQAVNVSPVSFESRKALPEAWRGVRDDELSKVSGIEGCVFVHASGFIGGNNTEDGIMKMAFAALGQAA